MKNLDDRDFAGLGPGDQSFAGTQRKRAVQSRTSMDDSGTIPARRRQEAQLQKWTFEALSAVAIIAVTANA